MMMQENFDVPLAARPNFTARSTTGTTVPRRFVTPRIQTGVLGTVVIASYLTISFTFPMLTAYSSPAVKKVRYCTTLREGCSLFWLEASIFHSLHSCRTLRGCLPVFSAAETASGRTGNGLSEGSKIVLLRGLAIAGMGVCEFR